MQEAKPDGAPRRSAHRAEHRNGDATGVSARPASRFAGPSASGVARTSSNDHRQPIHPRAERCITFEAPQFPVSQQENILQEIVGLATGAGHPVGQIVEPRGVLSI
jgi:hypothetical protein